MISVAVAARALRELEAEFRVELERLRPILEREPADQLAIVLEEMCGPEEVSLLPLNSAVLVEFAILGTQEHFQRWRHAALLEGDMTEEQFALYEDQMRSAVIALAPFSWRAAATSSTSRRDKR